jgi:hypothetical protein
MPLHRANLPARSIANWTYQPVSPWKRQHKSVSIQFGCRGPPHPGPLPKEREHCLRPLLNTLNGGLKPKLAPDHPLLGERAGVRGTDASE